MAVTSTAIFVGAAIGTTTGAALAAATGGDIGAGAAGGFLSGAATGGLGASFGGAPTGSPDFAPISDPGAGVDPVSATAADLGSSGATDTGSALSASTQSGMAGGMSGNATDAALGPSDMGAQPFTQEAQPQAAGSFGSSPYDNLSATPSAAQTGMATPFQAAQTFAGAGQYGNAIHSLGQYLPNAGSDVTKKLVGSMLNSALGGGSTGESTQVNNYNKGNTIQPLGMAPPAQAGVVNPVTAANINNQAANQPSNSTQSIQTVGQPISANNTINNTTSDLAGNQNTGTKYTPYQIPPLGSPLTALLADQNIKTSTAQTLFS